MLQMTQFIGLRHNEADNLVFISYIISDRDDKINFDNCFQQCSPSDMQWYLSVASSYRVFSVSHIIWGLQRHILF